MDAYKYIKQFLRVVREIFANLTFWQVQKVAKKDISLCLTCDKRNTKSWKFFILLTDLPFGPKNTYMLYKKFLRVFLEKFQFSFKKWLKMTFPCV